MSYLVRALGPVAFVVLAPVVAARWMLPSMVPVSRLQPGLESRVERRPNDARAHYLLGRLHSAAFAAGREEIAATFVTSGPELDAEVRDAHIGGRALQKSWAAKSPSSPLLPPSALLEHLSVAIEQLGRAVEIRPDEGLYQLGLGHALDTGAHLSDQVDSPTLERLVALPTAEEDQRELDACLLSLGADVEPAKKAAALKHLRDRVDVALPKLSARRADPDASVQREVAGLLAYAWREFAIRCYEEAHDLALNDDMQVAFIPMSDEDDWFDDLVSVEAGRGYQRLVRERGIRDDSERAKIEQIDKDIAAVHNSDEREYPITPILVPGASDATLRALFDGASATFDLSGAGIQQTWEWPTTAASFLVWDPECTGSITSGRQLFGSATWWMFFEDGYRALEALDEDGDGWLAGRELEGLALWRDADRDGVSDAGEVASLAARGLVALNVRADGVDGLSPTCSRGALFADGTTRPTFDWVASPLPPQP